MDLPGGAGGAWHLETANKYAHVKLKEPGPQMHNRHRYHISSHYDAVQGISKLLASTLLA